MASMEFPGNNHGFQVGVINRLSNADFHLLPERPDIPPSPLSTVPFNRDPDFVSRDILLHRIHEKSSAPGCRIALVGLGGIGKSQLAIEYSYQVRSESPETWVFWVHASNEARFEQSFRHIADTIKISGRRDPKANIFKLVENWLRDEKIRKWICILDNLGDDGLLYSSPATSEGDAMGDPINASTKPLLEYIPRSSNGSTIITSRTREVALKIVNHKDLIEVNQMERSEAQELLQKKLTQLGESRESRQLVEELERIPLAIVQAASYIEIRAPRYSVSQYLKDFRRNDRKAINLLGTEAGHLYRDWEAKNSILVTWQMSFDHIRHTKPSAADLLSLMSFFDRQEIPEKLIRHQPEASLKPNLELSDDSSAGETSEYDVDPEFKDSITTLSDYSFISMCENCTSFTMNRLVQLTTRAWLISHGEIDQWREKFVSNLYREFPTGRYENWGKCRSLFPHVRSAISQRPESVESLLKWATLLYRGAWYASESGNIADLREMATKSRQARIKILGSEDKEALASTDMLAKAYSLEGWWGEAEQLFMQAMETRKTKLGADHPDTLASMANLASTYLKQGRWEEAEQLNVQVLMSRKTKLGADHLDTLASMANLASTYLKQGRWEEAEQLNVQVLMSRKTKLGADDPDTLASMANLASTYLKKGRWEEAEQLNVQVLMSRKTKLGTDHPDTLASMANLASTYRKQRRWEDAEQLEVQVMETRKTKFGADHPDTLMSMANLASTYPNQGRWEDAEQLNVQVLETRKTKFGADHPDTLMSMANLASTYRNQGRWEEAEQLEEQVLVSRRQMPGPGHLHTLDVSLETAEHNRHVNLGDSDSSIENESVFSVPFSIPSTRSLDSGRGELDSLLIQEFANLLNEDRSMLTLLLIGVSKEKIGFERMRNNFRRLLKNFANNLKADILSESHRDLRRFISSYSVMITCELFAMAPIDEQRKIKHTVLEAEHGMLSVEKRLAHQRKMESYFQSLHNDGTAPQTSQVIEVLDPDAEGSDQESMAEEAGEDEPYKGSLQNLDQMKYFILESSAYQILRRRLKEFVQPSLNCRFRDLVTRWSNPGHKNYGDVARYKLRNLVTDLQDVSPFEIRFERDEISSQFVMFISHYQHLIERWTGEPWDWWPLPRFARPLAESEARLRWKCVCGEERWAEVPNTLVKRLQSIIRCLPVVTSPTQITQPPPEVHTRSDPSPCGIQNSIISDQGSYENHGVEQPNGSPSYFSLHRRPSGIKANIADISITRHRVLFLAKKGGDYRLAQICVSNMNCYTFFSTMKKEYFRLRGVLRGWFSVWRYSHCEFYKFEKFDDHEFTLRIKDSFPDHANVDYEYQPKPMDNIPPISEHEFMKRFYACHKPRPLLHLHHQCRKLKAHSSDILKFLPKKRTELEEAGNKREDFWGIYARESISLRWIILYNLVCVSPLLAFLLAWIVPRGLVTDLQNPSIPLSMMIAMLSLFWSVYLGSLQFGKPH
ncbi:unnamed protein product [Penicillium crustosum]